MPRSNHILVKLAGTFLILCCAACNPKHDAVRRDMNGFVLGDDSRPPPVFAIGVGDGLERFYEKNAFLNIFRHGVFMDMASNRPVVRILPLTAGVSAVLHLVYATRLAR